MSVKSSTLECIGVRQAYGDRLALKDLTLSMTSTTTALIGVNGAGKSTLLRTLAGAQKPDSGSVLVAGCDPYSKSGRMQALRRVALMPQDATFPGGMTALDVVAHIGWLRGLRSRVAETEAHAALHKVGLSERAHSKMRSLSGGMLRRVALAQAIVASPEVLLLDEPSTGLDPEQRRGMIELVKELPGAVVFSSHVIEDVVEVAKQIVVLHEGKLLFSGSIDQLVNQQNVSLERSSEALELAFLALIRGGSR